MPISPEPLRILLVEDSEDDCELILRHLTELPGPYVWEQVATEAELRAALQRFHPQLVLSDHTMPGFNGKRALQLVRELAPETPFIFVSGTIGEEAAIEALQRGAVDYVLKDNLRRLPAAVSNALVLSARREELERTGQALRESEARFRAIVDSTGDWVWETDRAHRIVYCNRSVERALGYLPEAIIGRHAIDFVHPDDRELFIEVQGAHLAAGTGWHLRQTRWIHADDSIRWLESTAAPRTDAAGAILGFRGIDRDVTQRIMHEAKIQQLGRFHAMLSALGNAVVRARSLPALLERTCRLAVEQGQFRTAVIGLPNDRGQLEIGACAGDDAIVEMLRALGPADPASPAHQHRPSVRVFGSGLKEVAADTADARVSDELRQRMEQLGMRAQVVLPVGTPPWAVLGLYAATARAFDPDEVEVLERVATEIDYARTALAHSERLQYLAYHDPVTGLPNRTSFRAYADALIRTQPIFVGALHVADFRLLHDERGHELAQSVLTAVGNKLRTRLEDLGRLAHQGGEYFLLAGPMNQDFRIVLDEIGIALAECNAAPVMIDDEPVHVTLRAGVAVSPDHGRDLDVLERHALSALAHAERADAVTMAFSDEMRVRAERRVKLERELRIAVEEKQFELHLQPVFRGEDGRLVGAEALIRWEHPTDGRVSPGEFIPLLESTGLIAVTGQWVLRTAQSIVTRWQALGLGDFRIAVNVSARELRQDDFVERCRAVLGDSESHVDIEVTESLLMDDIERNILVLQGLRDLGCRVAVDDFGTGYSSLSYLSRLPVDTLKIDQSFTSQLHLSADTLGLVTNIIALGHSLKLNVVAEGVENEEQQKLLRLLRCDELQGYLLGRPVPLAEFESRYLDFPG